MNTVANALIEHEPTQPPAPVEPVSESTAIFRLIDRLSRDPNADPDRIERFIAMRNDEIARLAKLAFYEAMSAAQADMKPVARDADNDQTKSRYARYETISEAIQPIVTKHGFSLTFGEGDTPKENHIRVLCDVMHVGGHMKQYHADVPFDNVGMKGNPNKTATHAYGSTKSYGKRYLKLDIFDVQLKDEDDDGNASGRGTTPISEDQLKRLRDLIELSGADIQICCEKWKVQALPDLPAAKFDEAYGSLERWHLQQQKQQGGR